jgi:hypothetical protein
MEGSMIMAPMMVAGLFVSKPTAAITDASTVRT